MAFAHDTRSRVSRAYSVSADSSAFFKDAAVSLGRGKEVLEFGSGLGRLSRRLADVAASVVGIDISPVAVDLARGGGIRSGLRYEVMDAEATQFDDASFDLVVGKSVLHHLDLDRACKEVRRLVRTGGAALFLEPLATHAAIRLFRWLTPRLRSADEHPLTRRDLRRLARYFSIRRLHYFHILSVFVGPIVHRAFGRWLAEALARVDRNLLKAFPWAQRFAWIVIAYAEIDDASA